MMEQRRFSWKFAAIVAAFAAIFYYCIAWQVPYTGDDWDWGLDIGLQHLLTADINSRYAGNLFAVIMTRSKLAQTVIMGTCSFLLPALLTVFAADGTLKSRPRQSLILFLAGNCLLLTMDSEIWQQTYGWVSGFANYGISAVLITLCLCLAAPVFREDCPGEKAPAAMYPLYLLLGIVIQLFLENLSVFMVLFSGVLCLTGYLRSKTLRREYLVFFAGTVIGLLVMFSSTIYPTLFESGATLGNGRQLSYDSQAGLLGLAAACLENFSREMAMRLWENNTIICCSISVLLIFLWLKHSEARISWLGRAMMVIDMLSIPYFITFSHLEYGKYILQGYGLLKLFEVVINLGFFAVVALQVILLYRSRRGQMGKLLLVWFSAPAVLAPLTAVVFEGYRFYLTSNIFLIAFVLLLLADCITDIPRRYTDFLQTLGLSALLSCCLFYGFIYREINICTRQRMEIIAETKQIKAGEITLPSYPYMVLDYVWWPNPGDEYRDAYFREFFGLEPEVVLTFQDNY